MNLDALHLIILLPALGGLACYILGRTAPPLSRVVALVSTAVPAWLAGYVADTGLPRYVQSATWLNLAGGFDLSIRLAATTFTGWLVVASALFSFLIVLYSTSYFAGRGNEGRYYAFVLWAAAGAAGALLADNLLFLLICWEVVTLMLYLLVGLGPGEAGRKAAAKTFVILGLSDCALLLGIVLVWSQAGSLSIYDLTGRPLVPSTTIPIVAFLLMTAGALAKAGAMPLHTWVPAAAEAAPTPVMAFLPASLDKLLGIYLLAVVSLGLFDLGADATPATLRTVLMLIGAATILGAVGMAMVQHNLKKLLSFHAVSQVGYMVLGIGTGLPLAIAGGLFHMVNNAIYKSALFLGVGSVEHRTGTVEIERLGGLARAMPITFVAMTIAALSISGVPPFNGFASKWLVYQGVLELKSPLAPLLVAAAVFGSALTLASFIKVLYGVFLGREPEALAPRRVREVHAAMWAPMVLLAIVCVFFGVCTYWPAHSLLAPALANLGVQKATAAQDTLSWTTQAMSAATLLLVLGIVLGALVVWVGRGLKVREADVFLCGDRSHPPSEVHRTPATGFYETVRELGGLNPLYQHAEQGAFDVYHIGGSYGIGLVETLRKLHTGVLSLYVGWCVLGLGVILAVILALQ